MLDNRPSLHKPTTGSVQIIYKPQLDSWFVRDSEGRTRPSSDRQVEGMFGRALLNAARGELANVWIEIAGDVEEPASIPVAIPRLRPVTAEVQALNPTAWEPPKAA